MSRLWSSERCAKSTLKDRALLLSSPKRGRGNYIFAHVKLGSVEDVFLIAAVTMKLFYREASIYVLVALLFQTCVASRHGLAPRAVKTPRAPSPMIPISPRIFERDSGAIDYALADDESWTWGSGLLASTSSLIAY